MRQIIASFVLICILLGAIRCIYSVESRQLHEEELELAVETAMRHSLTEAGVKKRYSIASDRELYADFLGELGVMLSADAEYEVNLYEANLKEGKMDVEVVSKFTLPGGKKETVSCRKCAVLVEL